MLTLVDLKQKLSSFDPRILDLRAAEAALKTWLCEAYDGDPSDGRWIESLLTKYLTDVSNLDLNGFIRMFPGASYAVGYFAIMDPLLRRAESRFQDLLRRYRESRGSDDLLAQESGRALISAVSNAGDDPDFRACRQELSEIWSSAGSWPGVGQVSSSNYEEYHVNVGIESSVSLAGFLNQELAGVAGRIAPAYARRSRKILEALASAGPNIEGLFFQPPILEVGRLSPLLNQSLEAIGFKDDDYRRHSSIYMYQNFMAQGLNMEIPPLPDLVQEIGAILRGIDIDLGEIAGRILKPEINFYCRPEETPDKGTYCIHNLAPDRHSSQSQVDRLPIIYCRYDRTLYTACQLAHECAHAAHYHLLKEKFGALEVFMMDFDQSEGFALHVEGLLIERLMNRKGVYGWREQLRAKILVDWRFLFMLPLFSHFERLIYRNGLTSIADRQSAFMEAWAQFSGKDPSRPRQYLWLLYPYHDSMPGNGDRFLNALLKARCLQNDNSKAVGEFYLNLPVADQVGERRARSSPSPNQLVQILSSNYGLR